MFITCMPLVCGDQKRALESLKLELWKFVRFSVGQGTGALPSAC